MPRAVDDNRFIVDATRECVFLLFLLLLFIYIYIFIYYIIVFRNIAKGCERDKKGHFSDTPFTAASPRRQPHNLNARYHNNNIW